MTQASLASACNVEVRTLQRWFAGQRVTLEDAERLAGALGVGTADVFDGVPEDGIATTLRRIAQIQRLLSARDGPFTQGLRLMDEHFQLVYESVWFSAYPTSGFVFRHTVPVQDRNGFVVLRVTPSAERASILLRSQVGRNLAIAMGRVNVDGSAVCLLETFMVRSMLARRLDDGSFWLWVWSGIEQRELMLVSTTEFQVTVAMPSAEQRQIFDLTAARGDHTVCLRPGVTQLRAAGLPMGFDRLLARDTSRVDIPVESGVADVGGAGTTHSERA